MLVPSADGADISVDARNRTGVEDGSAANPYATISAAVAEAASGDVIRIAAGDYVENVIVRDKTLALEGGFPGAIKVVAGIGQGLGLRVVEWIWHLEITEAGLRCQVLAVIGVGQQAASVGDDAFAAQTIVGEGDIGRVVAVVNLPEIDVVVHVIMVGGDNASRASTGNSDGLGGFRP